MEKKLIEGISIDKALTIFLIIILGGTMADVTEDYQSDLDSLGLNAARKKFISDFDYTRPTMTWRGRTYNIDELQSTWRQDRELGKKNKFKIYKGLLERGFTKTETAVIMGNLAVESGFNPESQLTGVNRRSGIREDSYGLMQWRDSVREQREGTGRLKKLKDLAEEQGKHFSDLDVQLDYIKYELKGRTKADGTFEKGPEARNFEKAMRIGARDKHLSLIHI